MMFEAVELGRKISKADFSERVPTLRTEMLAVQRKLRTSPASVIVIVSGVEGAGKSEVVNRLTAWLDARGVHTHAFWDETDDERQRPRPWRFWRRLPARGTVGIMFGSWYTQPIIDRALGHSSDGEFERAMTQIETFERMLSHDGHLVVKFWFHLSRKAQKKRLKEKRKQLAKAREEHALSKDGKKEKREKGRTKRDKRERGVDPLVRIGEEFGSHYEAFARVSERAIHRTDTGTSPWHLIDAEDKRFRDLAAGEALLHALGSHLAALEAEPTPATLRTQAVRRSGVLEAAEGGKTVLDRVDLSQALEPAEYSVRLEAAQAHLAHLSWELRLRGRSCVAAFEGWDAAGKGGAIRRVVASMDARLFRVIPIAAPTEEERARHYLWRFWRHIPRDGRIVIFDRSWYGRVLVERIEGFAREEEWRRAYREINAFEEQLVEHGIGMAKFWIHISAEEQLRRFEERKQTPWKQHKITDEDWRNREQWAKYEEAIDEMVARTSTHAAPWTLVAGNDKRFARVQIIETLCAQIERCLEA